MLVGFEFNAHKQFQGLLMAFPDEILSKIFEYALLAYEAPEYQFRMLPEVYDDIKNVHLFLCKGFFNASWYYNQRILRSRIYGFRPPSFSFLGIQAVEFLTLTIQAFDWARPVVDDEMRCLHWHMNCLALNPHVNCKTRVDAEQTTQPRATNTFTASNDSPQVYAFARELAVLLRLKTLTFEFEVVQTPALLRRLDNFMESAHGWAFTLGNGNVLRLDSSNIEAAEWTYDDNMKVHQCDIKEGVPSRFLVKRLTWKVESI